MRIEIDLTSPWPHIICFLIIILVIPESRKRLTTFGVYIFATLYRFFGWVKPKLCPCLKPPTEREIAHEQQFKSLTSNQVAEQLKRDSEYRNISGFVTFKWGFPYIFRTRHLQLYKTTLIIRDADKMKKYNRERLELQHQQRLLQSQQSFLQQKKSNNDNDTNTNNNNNNTNNNNTNTDEIDNENDQDNLIEQLSLPITSRTFQPPKPLWTFNFSGGKVINSRIPLTLKCVSTKTEACYLTFKDRDSFARWCKIFVHNLHVELTENWRSDARKMLHAMQNQQSVEKLQQSTPVKKRPILSPSSPS